MRASSLQVGTVTIAQVPAPNVEDRSVPARDLEVSSAGYARIRRLCVTTWLCNGRDVMAVGGVASECRM